MRTVEEHLAQILATLTPGEPRRVPISAAAGLVVAETVTSRVDLPGFDNSAMDGYAVRARCVAAAHDADPGSAVTLRVVGEVAAGADATVPVDPGTAVRIMTGAMMPAGADAVVKVEDTDGGVDAVQIRQGALAGTSVRPRGEDIRAGDVVLDAGAVLDARRIALLAATGHGAVLVRPRPRVGVVSTGSELVPPGGALGAGQIHDSNSYMLEALVRECGAEPLRCDPLPDDAVTLVAALRGLAAEVDVVVTSGGVSMGAYDVVKEGFQARPAPDGEGGPGLGAGGTTTDGSGQVDRVEFVQVAMQPGKPQGFGVLGPHHVPFFALPGNPVSAYVSFVVFARPALRRIMGLTPEVPVPLVATLASALRSPAARRQIARAVVRREADGLWADPVWGQASHFIADLSRANAFVVVPEEMTVVEAGSPVEVWLLPGAEDRWPQ